MQPETSAAEPTGSPEVLRAVSGAGLRGPVAAEGVAGGRNNRILRLRTRDGDFILKIYFRHPSDLRDRLRQEFGFLTYLWSRGVRRVPRAIWADYGRRLGLYQFIDGRRPSLEEIAAGHVERAVSFYRQINRENDKPGARRLPSASEACFSPAEHLERAAARIERVQSLPVAGDLDRTALDFVRSELVPLWAEIRAALIARFGGRRAPFKKYLPWNRRCLSPSDFGFHNSLIDGRGMLHFLDFEYAGWDDPAKLACDFANQPDVLLSEDLSRRFQAAVIAGDPAPDDLARRIAWLTPVYQIKWACIILNDFLPHGRARSSFLGGRKDRGENKIKQLEKARMMLKRARAAFDGIG